MSHPESTTKNKALSVTLAPFWKRLMAWVYDSLGALAVFILALVVGYLVIYVVTLPWVSDGLSLSTHLYQNPLWGVYLFACIQYYYVWCWVKGGQTVGMKTWHLKLCKADGSLLTWKEAYIRSFLSCGGIANLWCLIDQEKRGWHDLFCDARVVVLPKHINRPTQPLI
ncbi:RDD family protein [Aliikangiella sp. IMCC44653]